MAAYYISNKTMCKANKLLNISLFTKLDLVDSEKYGKSSRKNLLNNLLWNKLVKKSKYYSYFRVIEKDNVESILN